MPVIQIYQSDNNIQAHQKHNLDACCQFINIFYTNSVGHTYPNMIHSEA